MKKNIILTIIILLVLTYISSYSLAYEIECKKVFTNELPILNIESYENEHIIMAISNDNLKKPYPYIVKVDKNWNKSWEVKLDHVYSTGYTLSKIDNGYVIFGLEGEPGKKEKLFMSKLNYSGEEVFYKNYEEEDNIYLLSAKVVEDKGFIITGNVYKDQLLTDSRLVLWNINKNGKIVGRNNYNNDIFIQGLNEINNNSGYLSILSYIHEKEKQGLDLIKFDYSGNVAWNNFVSIDNISDTYLPYSLKTIDQYIISFLSKDEKTNNLYFIDSEGNFLEKKALKKNDYIYSSPSLFEHKNGIIISSSIKSENTSDNSGINLIYLDETRKIIWDKVYSDDIYNVMFVDSFDNKIIVIGRYNKVNGDQGIYLMKINQEGEKESIDYFAKNNLLNNVIEGENNKYFLYTFLIQENKYSLLELNLED